MWNESGELFIDTAIASAQLRYPQLQRQQQHDKSFGERENFRAIDIVVVVDAVSFLTNGSANEINGEQNQRISIEFFSMARRISARFHNSISSRE